MESAYAPKPTQRFIAREGYPFILICVAACALCSFFSYPLAALWVGAGLFVAFFFRNPKRVAPSNEDLIISPADGRIVAVQPLADAPYVGGPAIKVSIFMSVLNVHMNRMPVGGTVREVVYKPGKFLVASLDKASEHNEQNILVLERPCGRKLAMVQIAGLVARRIICYVKPGDTLIAGTRLGLIRFGSRVDLYLPTPNTIDVKLGDRVKAGTTIIGRWA
jgi:phosphatidylserine decarboxylase